MLDSFVELIRLNPTFLLTNVQKAIVVFLKFVLYVIVYIQTICQHKPL